MTLYKSASPWLPSALFLKHLTKFWFQPYWTFSTISALKWNLENTKDRYLRQIFLFEFGGNNAIEVHVTNGKQIFP